MSAPHNLFNTLQKFDLGDGRQGSFYSLPALEKAGVGPVSKLPVSIRLVLESVLRNCDGKKVSEAKRPRAGELEADRNPHGGNSVHRRAHRAAGFHRRAAAGGFGGDALRRSAAGQKSENHRAARAGGPGGGPFGAGGFRRQRGCVAEKSGDGIPAQPRALPVSQMGHAGVRHVQGRAARHRHRPPGQSGISRQGRAVRSLNPQLSTLNHLLSRHAGRHGFAHDDDQRPRHRGLGRRRHRGRSRHARPAGLFPHAGRRRRASHRRVARGRHRHRPRAHRHGNAPQGKGRRQVRRIFRPRRGGVAGGGPRDHCEHGARIRRDDGLLPD